MSQETPQRNLALDLVRVTEAAALLDAGYSLERVLTVDDLVKSEDCFFAATGISGGTFLKGVEFTGTGAVCSWAWPRPTRPWMSISGPPRR